MYTKIFSIAFVAILGLTSYGNTTVQAQATKIGFTDHEIIIASMPRYGEIQTQLQQEFTAAQEALQSLAASFQQDVEEYQVQSRLLTEERRTAREAELAQRQQELQNAASKKDQDLAELEAQLMSPIFEQVQVAIDEVAVANDLDVVLRHRVGTQPVILYVSSEVIDITIEVAKKLGIEVPEDDGTASVN